MENYNSNELQGKESIDSFEGVLLPDSLIDSSSNSLDNEGNFGNDFSAVETELIPIALESQKEPDLSSIDIFGVTTPELALSNNNFDEERENSILLETDELNRDNGSLDSFTGISSAFVNEPTDWGNTSSPEFLSFQNNEFGDDSNATLNEGFLVKEENSVFNSGYSEEEVFALVSSDEEAYLSESYFNYDEDVALSFEDSSGNGYGGGYGDGYGSGYGGGYGDGFSNLILDATVPEISNLGNSINANWTVTNIGDEAALSSWNDEIYLSDDNVLDELDFNLKSFTYDNDTSLEAGASYTINEEITIPPTATLGNKYILFVTDSNSSIEEGNEADNVLAVPIEIVDFQPLSFGETIESNLAETGYQFRLSDDGLFYFDSLTPNTNLNWSLTGADGTVVENRSFNNSDGDNISNPIIELDAGDYVIDIDGNSAGNNFAFRFWNLDEATVINTDEAITGNFDPLYETDIYQFEGTEGERFFIDYLGGGRSQTRWRLLDPEGNFIFNNTLRTDSESFTLSQTGIYTVLVEDDIYYHSPEDYSFSIRAMATEPQVIELGETVTGDILQDEYSFTLNEEKWVYFDSLLSSNYRWTLTNVDTEEEIDSKTFNTTDGRYTSNPTLRLNQGNYLIEISGLNIGGEYSFNLKDIEAEVTTIVLGEEVTGVFEPNHETDIYQFEGVAGGRYYVDYLAGAYIGQTGWRLIAPDGSEVFNRPLSQQDVGDLTFEQTGTYTMFLEDYISSSNPRQYRFNFREMATEPQVIELGETVTGDILQDEYSFTLNEEKWVYFDSLLSSNYRWTLTNVDTEEEIDSKTFNTTDGRYTSNPTLRLNQGNYLIEISGLNIGGEYSFNLKDIEAEATTIVLGEEVAGVFEPNHETDIYQFEGVAGGRYYVDYLAGAYIGQTGWRLIAPDGSEVFNRPLSQQDVGDLTFEQTGTYTMFLEDYISSSNPRQYRFNFREMATEPQVIELGETVTGDILQDEYSFTLNEEKWVYFDSLLSSNYRWTLTNVDTEEEIDSKTFNTTDGRYTSNPTLRLNQGNYLIEISGLNIGGEYSFNLKDIEAEATTIVLGEEVAGVFEPNHETDIYQFEGVAGGRYYVDYLAGAYIGQTGWRLIAPDGSEVFNRPLSQQDVGDLTFEQTGTYTMFLEDYISSSNPRQYRFNFREMATEPQVIELGETVTGDILQDEYSFTLNEEKWVYFDSLLSSNYRWTLTNVDTEEEIDSKTFNTTDGRYTSNPTLRLNQGNYLIEISGLNIGGEYSFNLKDIEAEATTIVLGEEVAGVFEPNHETDIYQFEGVAGGRYYVDYLAGAYIGQTGWRLIAPDGSEVFNRPLSQQDVGDLTFEQTGTYTLFLEDFITNSNPREYLFQISQIELTQELILGETVTNKLTTDSYSFTLNEDSLLYFDSLTNNSSFKWNLTSTDDTEIVNQRQFTRTDANDISNPVLKVSAGDYLLEIDGDDTTIDLLLQAI